MFSGEKTINFLISSEILSRARINKLRNSGEASGETITMSPASVVFGGKSAEAETEAQAQT